MSFVYPVDCHPAILIPSLNHQSVALLNIREEFVNPLITADDIALLCQSRQCSHKMLRQLCSKSLEAGLEVNTEESNTVSNRQAERRPSRYRMKYYTKHMIYDELLLWKWSFIK